MTRVVEEGPSRTMSPERSDAIATGSPAAESAKVSREKHGAPSPPLEEVPVPPVPPFGDSGIFPSSGTSIVPHVPPQFPAPP
mmetsp:Transcript_16079/g.36782  ORF Transcript_16079/g.36782 Transcript_16079/m.36782 type:complete len:82 (+) Transcript_16079:909-1154(+)